MNLVDINKIYPQFLNSLYVVLKAAHEDENFDAFAFLHTFFKIPFPLDEDLSISIPLSRSLVAYFSYEAEITTRDVRLLIEAFNEIARSADEPVYRAAVNLINQALIDPETYLDRIRKLHCVSGVLKFFDEHKR